MDVKARLSGCAAQAAEAVSAYTRVKMEGCKKYSKIGVSRHLDTSSTTQVVKIMVKHRRPSGSSWTKSVRSPACWLLVGENLTRFSWNLDWKRHRIGNVSCVHRKQKIVLIGTRGWHQRGWTEAEYPCGRIWWKKVDLDEPSSFLDHVYLGCIQRECKPNESIFGEYKKMSESRIAALSNWKNCQGGKNLTEKLSRGRTIWKDTRKNASRDCELAIKKTELLYEVPTPRLDDHNFKEAELETVGELTDVCSQIVLECLYLARIGPETNFLKQSPNGQELVTDAQLVWFLTFFSQMTIDKIVMWVIQLNTAEWVLPKTLILVETWKIQNQLQGWIFCIFGSRTLVPMSWMCKKQTSISLDAGLRMDGILALDLWDVVI